MSGSFRFLIRDGLERDIAACLDLDTTYETAYVWQMSIQQDPGQSTVVFKTERLPRAMDVTYAVSGHRLRLALPKEQCFLVAIGRDEPEILGYLVMGYNAMMARAWVHDIVVSRPFRRRRIGTRLLNIARQWASEHDAWQLTVETQTKNYPAIQFCQSAGLGFCGFSDQYFQNQDIAVFFGQTLR
jgi:GNAT superfamily N-acetyltransferase